MSYTKQNFVHGQILTAEQLNHIEDGIEKILPAIEAGSEKQLVSNAEGNLVWLDTTHGYKIEEGLLCEEFTVVTGAKTYTPLTFIDKNSEVHVFIDGTETNDFTVQPVFAGQYQIAIASKILVRYSATTILVFPSDDSFNNRKITIKVINKIYNKID